MKRRPALAGSWTRPAWKPVTIEKHGRPVAVLVSKEEFDESQARKLEMLRAEVQRGIDAIESGGFSEYKEADLKRLAGQVKAEARGRKASS